MAVFDPLRRVCGTIGGRARLTERSGLPAGHVLAPTCGSAGAGHGPALRAAGMFATTQVIATMPAFASTPTASRSQPHRHRPQDQQCEPSPAVQDAI